MEYKYVVQVSNLKYNEPFFFGELMDPVCIVLTKDLEGRDKISAHTANCPHKGAHLGDGRVIRDGNLTLVQCPWHGCEFDLVSGVSTAANSFLRAREVVIENGVAYVR